MIGPGRHLLTHRSLLGMGAVVLGILRRPMTVSGLWDRLRSDWGGTLGAPITYGSFTLVVDFLYLVGAVELRDGVVRRTVP